MKPSREHHDSVVRDLRQILTSGEVGIQWGDNIGPTVSFDYLDASAPITVLLPARVVPTSVHCLNARRKSDGRNEGGCRIVWQTSGPTLTVTDIDVSDTASVYLVTLGIMVG